MQNIEMEHGTHIMEQGKNQQFHDILKQKMDVFAHMIYRLSRDFPKEEIYGTTSQIRRAALSIILNYLEGYARNSGKIYSHFLDISYGSLQETKYLLQFTYEEKYFSSNEYKKIMPIAEEIGAMLWSTL